jgi:recombination protein RecT
VSNLAIIEKIDAIAGKKDSRFMQALVQALPQCPMVLAPALVRQALTVIKASESLQRASEYSLFTSIAEVAQAGLSLDLHLGQCFLVPFAGVCTVLYGYRGLMELGRRSGEVGDMRGEIRYAKDKFELTLGSDRRLIHVPADLPPSKRGERLGAYAICELLRSRTIFEYMTMEEIDKIKNAVIKRSEKKGKQSIWQTDNEPEMVRKTPLRRLSKFMPQSPSLIPFIQAAIRDEYRQQGIHQVVDLPPLTVNEEVIPLVEVLREEKITEEEPRRTARESEIKETPKKEQKAEEKGPISGAQWDALYDQIPHIKGLTMQGVVGMMKKLGHSGAPRQFPSAKLQQLLDMMMKAGKK